jgi:Regulator of Chromosome Condensation (RCC1) repeat protein
LHENGSIACWGDDSEGQSSPPSGTGYTDIAVGTAHACALNAAGTAVCWGDQPSSYDLELVDITADDYSCGLDSSNDLWCWSADDEPEALP